MNERWNHDYVRAVRQKKDKHRDSPDLHGLLQLISESMYGTTIHWALELIQNAEDEAASYVSFTVGDDYVLVENDGEPFNRDDVLSICSAARSFKQNKIGFFGIGFKSVFHISPAPKIISGRFGFQIEEYLYPEPINEPEKLPMQIPDPDRGAAFLLPLKGNVPGTTLIERLREINDRLLLFLSSINTIEFRDRRREPEQDWVIKCDRDGQRWKISNSRSGQITSWRVFSRVFRVPSQVRSLSVVGKELAERSRLVVAFPYPDQDPYPDMAGECVYCFLPTRRRTDLPFLVHGDFIPALGRENIEGDDPWNEWLLERLPVLIAEALLKLRNETSFREQLFRYFPLPQEVADEDFQVVVRRVVDRLSGKAIAPVDAKKGEWDEPGRVAIVPAELKELIGPAELQAIYDSPCRPLDYAADERTREVLTELGTRIIDLQQIVALLNTTSLIAGKRPEWFLEIYDYLARRGDALFWERQDADPFDQLASTPFLLTSDHTLVKPVEEGQDRLITHHPQTKSLGNLPKIFSEGELVFLHPIFQLAKKSRGKEVDHTLEEKRERAREFLDRYGVKRLMREYHIIKEVVLPKFRLDRLKEYSERKVVILTNYIRENLGSYASRVRSQRTRVDEEQIYREISEKLHVRGVYLREGKTEASYFPPSELYFPPRGKKARSSLWRALQRMDEVPFVAPTYHDGNVVRGFSSLSRRGTRKKVPKWNEFFKAMGVWDCPRLLVRDVDLDRTREFGWVPHEHSTGDRTLAQDKYLPELQPLLDLFVSNPKRYFKALVEFRDSLAENWPRYQKDKWSIHEWFYYTRKRQKIEDASFVHQLRDTAWLAVESRPKQLFMPCHVYYASEMNTLILPRGSPLLRVPRGRARFFQTIGVREKPSKQMVLDYLLQLRASWQGESFPQDWARRMGAIYRFLLEPEEGEQGDIEFMNELVRRFETDSLIFLPTARRNWWSSREAFWEDKDEVFGPLRAYLSLAYSEDTRSALRTAGVRQAPSLDDCLEALEQLAIQWESWVPEERRLMRALVDQIYAETCSLLKHAGTVTPNYLDRRSQDDIGPELSALSADESGVRELLGKSIFLATDDVFYNPSEVFFCDDERLRPVADGRLNVLWLQTSWRSYLELFEAVGIRGLSTVVRVKPIYDSSNDEDTDRVLFIRELSELLKPYLKYERPGAYALLSKAKAFERLESLDVKLVPSLSVRYEIEEWTKVDLNVSAFYDASDNTLYVVAQTDWLTSSLDAVSAELASIFRESDVSLKTQIESLLSCGFDRQGRIRKFEALGVPPPILDQFEEAARLVLVEGTLEYLEVPGGFEATQEEEPEIVIAEVKDSEQPTPGAYVLGKKVEKLISVEDISSFTIRRGEQTTSYPVVASGLSDRESTRTPSEETPPDRPEKVTSTVAPAETEAVALAVIERYEMTQGRQPTDRHREVGLGYDIESSERFVEAKSFKQNPGRWSLTPAEWEAAVKYENNYYVYVVSNLLVGHTPRIQVIQNPRAFVGFHVPGVRQAQTWDPAVSEDVLVRLSTPESSIEEDEPDQVSERAESLDGTTIELVHADSEATTESARRHHKRRTLTEQIYWQRLKENAKESYDVARRLIEEYASKPGIQIDPRKSSLVVKYDLHDSGHLVSLFFIKTQGHLGVWPDVIARQISRAGLDSALADRYGERAREIMHMPRSRKDYYCPVQSVDVKRFTNAVDEFLRTLEGAVPEQ